MVGEIEGDNAFLGEIGPKRDENFWSAELSVHNSPNHFKIDTGADMTVIESIKKG